MDARTLIRELNDAASRKDFARLSELYAEDAVAVSPVFGEVRGRSAIIETFGKTFEMLPDFSFEVSEILADADRFAILGTVTATDRNGWFGRVPSGTPFRYRLTILCTVRGGRIVHDERLYDLAGVVERLEKARIDNELRIASDVQSALLPRTSRTGDRWEAAADSIPCRAVGGDFFELLDLPSGDLAVALGDVEGKGTPAALVGAMLHGMLSADAEGGSTPAAMVQVLNRRLTAGHRDDGRLAIRGKGSRFVSLVYGVLSRDGRFAYANAGHVPPALLSRRGISRLKTTGPVLGAFPAARFEEGVVRVAAGDTLLMFSDGVTEARNSDDEEFGDSRLLTSASERMDLPPSKILDGVLQDVRDFVGSTPQVDDITLTVARFR